MPKRNLRCFHARAVAPKWALFWRDPPYPSQNWNLNLTYKIADLLHNEHFFLIARGISIMFGPLESMFSATDYVQHIFQPLCMPPKCCFYLRIGHIAHSLYFSTKAIFFWWSERVWMHFGPLCMQLRAPISFFLLFRTNSNPEKVQHFLVSPNSTIIAPNRLCFSAPKGSEVLSCCGRCTKISSFWGTHPTPLKTEISTLSTKSQTFYRINVFFWEPQGICMFFGPLGSTFSAPEHVQHLF